MWPETAYRIHPEWGLPEIDEGREALRTHTDGPGHTVVFQQVPVEPNAAGRVVSDHGKTAATEAGPYVELAKSFRTSETTASVRFILDTLIGCRYDEGHVTYDACVLAPIAGEKRP